MAENYPSDFNPREELKSKSERYAQMIYYGLPLSKLKEFDPIPDDADRQHLKECKLNPLTCPQCKFARNKAEYECNPVRA